MAGAVRQGPADEVGQRAAVATHGLVPGAGRHQRLDGRRRAGGTGHRQGRIPTIGSAVDGQTLRQQVADDVDIAALGRGVERRKFAGRLRQRIRARRQQGLHRRALTEGRRAHQGRLAPFRVAAVDRRASAGENGERILARDGLKLGGDREDEKSGDEHSGDPSGDPCAHQGDAFAGQPATGADPATASRPDAG